MGAEHDAAALRAQLDRLLEDSGAAELAWLVAVLNAARRPMQERISTGSGIVSQAFANDFAARLRIFHALHDSGEVLTKKGFEFAFKGASEAAGRIARMVDSDTHAGADLIVDDVGFSLKTEAAKGIRANSITISKLMESAWTKGFKSVQDFLAVMPKVVAHLQQYERIIVLRAFGRLAADRRVTYELVEIPCKVLLLAANVKASDFTPVTKAGGTTVTVRDPSGGTAYNLVFDGSDQKITVRNLATRMCTTHATWVLSDRVDVGV